MAKGVKKIQWAEGLIYPKTSIPDFSLTIAPDQFVWFKIKEWLPGTSVEDQKKGLTWMWMDTSRNIIIRQKTMPNDMLYGVCINKKLCGSYAYYIEASLSGKSDRMNNTGLYIRGWSEPKIICSKWCQSDGGPDVHKTYQFSYGEPVYLHIETEGLNGDKLTVEVYNRVTIKSDKEIIIYKDAAEVIDGEINLKINDTATWMPIVDNIQSVEEFYIKIKDASGKYLSDAGNSLFHGRYLRIKKNLVSNDAAKPTNTVPLKTGNQDINNARFEPCRFKAINIIELTITDGKAKPQTVSVFKEGAKLINLRHPQNKITRAVYFDFDKPDLRPDAQQTLGNILQFLLEHEYSVILLDAHADERGTDQYNMILSQQRADAVKKFFTEGHLDPKRIIATGHGKRMLKIEHATNEISHQENRRSDISFDFYGHGADAIVYETIAPGNGTKQLTLDVVDYDTTKCFLDTKHEKKIVVTDIGQKIDKGAKEISETKSSINFPVHSDLSAYNPYPLQYIWPQKTTPNKCFVDIHSCRYYTDKKEPTVAIHVYPDIKWTLKFEYACKNPIKYRDSWVKMRQARINDAVEKAQASDIDGYDGDLETVFKVALGAEWNESVQKAELSSEWEGKIRFFLKLFLKIKNTINALLAGEKGKNLKKHIPASVQSKIMATATAIGRQPVMLEVLAPGVSLETTWKLIRASKKEFENLVATEIEATLKFAPLIGAKGTLDLIAVAKYIPEVGQVVETVDKVLQILSIEVTFAISLVGEIDVEGSIKGNYLKQQGFTTNEGALKLTGELGLEIVLKAEGKWSTKSWFFEVDAKLSAAAKAYSKFKAHLGFGADEEGPFVEAHLDFGGVKIVLEVEAKLGKIGGSRKVDITIVNEKPNILGGKYHV